MRVASTWTPLRRSRDNSAERERSRSASPRVNSAKMKEKRSQLLQETIRQVRFESKSLEKAKQEVIKEITQGAYEMRSNERRAIYKSLNSRDDRCKRCIKEDLVTRTRRFEDEQETPEKRSSKS